MSAHVPIGLAPAKELDSHGLLNECELARVQRTLNDQRAQGPATPPQSVV